MRGSLYGTLELKSILSEVKIIKENVQLWKTMSDQRKVNGLSVGIDVDDVILADKITGKESKLGSAIITEFVDSLKKVGTSFQEKRKKSFGVITEEKQVEARPSDEGAVKIIEEKATIYNMFREKSRYVKTVRLFSEINQVPVSADDLKLTAESINHKIDALYEEKCGGLSPIKASENLAEKIQAGLLVLLRLNDVKKDLDQSTADSDVKFKKERLKKVVDDTVASMDESISSEKDPASRSFLKFVLNVVKRPSDVPAESIKLPVVDFFEKTKKFNDIKDIHDIKKIPDSSGKNILANILVSPKFSGRFGRNLTIRTVQ